MLALCQEPDRLDEGNHRRRAGCSLPEEVLASPPSVSLRAVLQLVAWDARVRPDAVRRTTTDPLNERVLLTFKAGHQLNTARLQLLHVLDVQTSLERLFHLTRARHAGMPTPELRELEHCMAEVRSAVALAGQAWIQAGPAFTRLTRLLPVQLEEEEPRFTPMACAELERLAHLWRTGFAGGTVPSTFSEERERYEKAAVDAATTTARVARTGDALRLAENGFRLGARGAPAVASALMAHSLQRRELMQKTVRACVARCTLYALVQRLPEHLGLK